MPAINCPPENHKPALKAWEATGFAAVALSKSLKVTCDGTSHNWELSTIEPTFSAVPAVTGAHRANMTPAESIPVANNVF
ncbi:hypothetical protein, partial [Thiolapillus sp.]|uniref:hypothetical protein n=1 Tax=Thiolapillus sp. TaxID=2017437 RepID=UPI0025DE1622